MRASSRFGHIPQLWLTLAPSDPYRLIGPLPTHKRNPIVARRPSSGNRSSRSTRTRTRSGSTARARKDDKVDIYCPQCAAHYRIPEESVDSKVTCRECTRTFFAKTTVGQRTRPPDNSKTYIGLGVTALVIIAGLVAISWPDPEPRRSKPLIRGTNALSELDLKQEKRRGQAIQWAGFMGDSDMIGIRSMTDVKALAGQLGVQPDLTGDAFDSAFLEHAKRDDCTRLLFEMKCTGAEVSRQATENDGGPATLYMIAKPGDPTYDKVAGARIEIQWRLAEGGQMIVNGYQLTVPPVIRGRRPGSGNRIKPSEDVEAPETREISLGGETIKVYESPPAPLGHLKGTTPEQQARIDELVAQLIHSADPESPGYLFSRATNALDKLVVLQEDGKERKPAIPRLLNALHDFYPDVMANNDKIRQVTRALLRLTGMQFAYDFRGDQPAKKPARESSIRQWFAWWWRYANDSHTEAIDKEEDLDSPTKPPGDGK